MSQSMMNAGKSQQAFDYPAVKKVSCRLKRQHLNSKQARQSLDLLLGMEKKIAE